MISIWLISFWENLKKPKKINIVELGAGNGEMMSQIIQTLNNFSEISLSANFLILEKSPLLIKIQKTKIDKKKVSWIKNLKEIPKVPTIFLANEFFDAFPIKQFLKKSNNWYEKYVAYKKDKFEVCDQKVSSKIIEQYLGKGIKKEKKFYVEGLKELMLCIESGFIVDSIYCSSNMNEILDKNSLKAYYIIDNKMKILIFD